MSGAIGSYAIGSGIIGYSATTATVIPTLLAPDFQVRIAQNFPVGWASQDALSTGNIGALMLAWAQGLESVQQQMVYAQSAIYMQTETSPELDLASMDFFGTALPRNSGETDASFYGRIRAALYTPAVTRAAISAALQSITGSSPRMIEPWNTGDTGAWDAVSYWDHDDRNNPWLAAGGSDATGYIVTQQAAGDAPLNGNPVPTWDDGLYWDVAGGFFGTIPLVFTESVYSLINALRAEGVTVGVKISATPPL